MTRPAAVGTVRLGYDLAVHDHVRDALAAGDLCVEQASVIIRAVTALPNDLDPDLVSRLLFGMVSSLAEWYRSSGPVDTAAIADTVTAIAFEGLTR